MSRSPPRFSDRKYDADRRGGVGRDGLSDGLKGTSGVGARGDDYSREQSVSDRGMTPDATAMSRTKAEQSRTQTQKGVSFKLGKKSDADKYVP